MCPQVMRVDVPVHMAFVVSLMDGVCRELKLGLGFARDLSEDWARYIA